MSDARRRAITSVNGDVPALLDAARAFHVTSPQARVTERTLARSAHGAFGNARRSRRRRTRGVSSESLGATIHAIAWIG